MQIELTEPQSEFFTSEARNPLFVGGYGSGKSITMALKALDDLSFPGAKVGLYCPTYDLLRLITIPYLEEFLTEADIPYKLNKSEWIVDVEGYGPLILRSMDNPGRIVGYQTFRAHIDEIDTLRTEHAREAWNKVIARNRQKVYIDGKIQQNRVSAYTTPEGFCFAYDRWVKNKKPGYELYKAPSWSNPHLPPDYIDTLRETYSEELVEAYVNAEFVNMRSGKVYTGFDRTLNHTDAEHKEHESLHIGMDFNIMKGASVVHVIRDGLPLAIDEIHGAYDTEAQVLTIKQRYPNNPINIYPDASGDKRSSGAPSQTDFTQLRMAGFNIIVDYSNPLIKDRVTSMNSMFLNANKARRYLVNTKKCPHYTNSLEQQIYDANGMPDKSNDLDHPVDAAGYFIYKKFPMKRPMPQQVHIVGNY